MKRAWTWLGGIILCLASFSYAEHWTVQTVAFPEEIAALEERDRLRSLGFQAYTEATSQRGVAYTRVRVGCYYTFEGAAMVAESLLNYTLEAVVIEKTSSTMVEPCFDHDLGVQLPSTWGVHTTAFNHISFWLDLAGQRVYLVYEQGWQLKQDLNEPRLTTLAASTPLDFYVWDDRLWARTANGESLVVGYGNILWQNGEVAVIEAAQQLLAIRIK